MRKERTPVVPTVSNERIAVLSVAVLGQKRLDFLEGSLEALLGRFAVDLSCLVLCSSQPFPPAENVSGGTDEGSEEDGVESAELRVGARFGRGPTCGNGATRGDF
jgi:hypothetical protein